MHMLLGRCEPASPRHPARLVGEAIEILGHAHDSLLNGRCRRTVRDARRMLVNMLETAYGGRNNNSGGGGGGRHANARRGGAK